MVSNYYWAVSVYSRSGGSDNHTHQDGVRLLEKPMAECVGYYDFSVRGIGLRLCNYCRFFGFILACDD